MDEAVGGKKPELIATRAWQNNPRADGQWSGKLTNPDKCFFLQLAALKMSTNS